jgi:hypothetical protein
LPGKLWWALIVNSALVALGAYLLVTGSPLVQAIGVDCLVIFGGAVVYFGRRMARPQPVLIVSRQGITDNSTAHTPGFVPWDKVADISRTRLLGQADCDQDAADQCRRARAGDRHPPPGTLISRPTPGTRAAGTATAADMCWRASAG